MSAMASQITGVSNVWSNVCSGVDQRKHQSSASLAFVRGIHRWPMDSPHKGPVTRKIFPFHDVIMYYSGHCHNISYLLRATNITTSTETERLSGRLLRHHCELWKISMRQISKNPMKRPSLKLPLNVSVITMRLFNSKWSSDVISCPRSWLLFHVTALRFFVDIPLP